MLVILKMIRQMATMSATFCLSDVNDVLKIKRQMATMFTTSCLSDINRVLRIIRQMANMFNNFCLSVIKMVLKIIMQMATMSATFCLSDINGVQSQKFVDALYNSGSKFACTQHALVIIMVAPKFARTAKYSYIDEKEKSKIWYT